MGFLSPAPRVVGDIEISGVRPYGPVRPLQCTIVSRFLQNLFIWFISALSLYCIFARDYISLSTILIKKNMRTFSFSYNSHCQIQYVQREKKGSLELFSFDQFVFAVSIKQVNVNIFIICLRSKFFSWFTYTEAPNIHLWRDYTFLLNRLKKIIYFRMELKDKNITGSEWFDFISS